MKDIRAYAQYNLCAQSIDVYFMVGDAVAEPVTIVDRPDQTSYIEPAIRLDDTAAQMLMDQLWKCGLRPSEGSGSAGALAATQKHLEDMRQITFNMLDINAGSK